MTISGTSRGRYEGGDNLDPANFTRFADHLVTVVNYLRRTHGFNITSLEPFNEPNSMWWQASRTQGGQQEGCTFQPATQKAFLPVLSNMMKARGLQGLVDLTSADEFAYNWAQFNQWGGADYSLTAKANVHGYGFAVSQEWNQQRLNWRRTVPASVGRAWMSELGGFGQTPQNVASMASNIVLDLNIARVTAWVFWQVLDGHPDWTLLRPMSSCLSCSWFDPNRFDPVPAPGFYGLMQFSNHIQRGSKILASSRSSDLDACVVCVVVAHLPSKSELVIVAVNNDDTATFNHLFDLSAIPSAVAASRSTGAAGSPSPLVTLAYRTWPAQQEFHAAVARPVVTAAAAFVYALPPLSTTTFLLRSVTL
ncbi:hypothetical protein HK105_208698 [Polyrhizophydium stewartii]|uniref:Endo-beta-1,6-galactanase-like domain-containing protein n=1 Tax=Polyrhizophydium stewartii TaxID=2732419 RepID=A0ABR4MX53_9FUNG